MRTLLRIENPAPKRHEFQHLDISTAIFGDAPLLYVDRPFITMHPSVMAQTEVSYWLKIFDENISVLTLLQSVVKRVGSRDVSDPTVLLRLPQWILEMLAQHYIAIAIDWNYYLYAEIVKYCETPESRNTWALFKSAGMTTVFPKPLTAEQKVWVVVCSNLDKRNDQQFILDVRESLYPWLNMDLFQAQEKSKKKRINEDYELQTKKMVEGTFDEGELDIIE